METIRKNQGIWLVVLIFICMGVILLGGIDYVSALRSGLMEQTVDNVSIVTKQQQQAFDNFITWDQERLHSFARYFSQDDSKDMEVIRQQLNVFGEVDAFYSVINLDTGYFCSNKSGEIYQMKDDELSSYQALSGRGVRDPYTGLYTDYMMFGYYECFTFRDGTRGLIQKSYDRSKVSNAFALSLYNDQGFSYVVNQKGDILLRPADRGDNGSYDNIFELLSGSHGENQDMDLI